MQRFQPITRYYVHKCTCARLQLCISAVMHARASDVSAAKRASNRLSFCFALQAVSQVGDVGEHGRFAKEPFKSGVTARRRIERPDEGGPFLFVEREDGSVREALRSPLLCAVNMLNHDEPLPHSGSQAKRQGSRP